VLSWTNSNKLKNRQQTKGTKHSAIST